MSPFVKLLEKIFLRDLQKLEAEIMLYPTEELIWKKTGLINNPAGNLCLHLTGNLQHFIGHVLGHSGYQRNRAFEFECSFLSRENLLSEIHQTRFALAETLPQLQEAELDEGYPVQVFQEPMTTRYFLMHLATHLNYHLGQINYHRRLIGQP
jgi:uncharacterized damage-inducible protein DinB